MKMNIKISLLTMSVFLIIMGVGSVTTIALFQSNYSEMLLNNIQGLGTNLQFDIEERMNLNLEFTALDDMNKKCQWLVEKNPKILAYCFIADLSGKILYHNDVNMIGQVLDDKAMLRSIEKASIFQQKYTVDGKTFFDVTLPVFTNSRHIGLLRLGAPMKILSGKINGIIFTILIIIIIFFITFSIIISVIGQSVTRPLKQIAETASRIADGETGLQASVIGGVEISTLSRAFNSMTAQLLANSEEIKKTNATLVEIIGKAKESIIQLNASTKEIQAAIKEQTNGANQQASGITEVSATLQELTITAKQITKNVGELVLSSEEVIKLIVESEKQLLQTVSYLNDAGKISKSNAAGIGELGKRSVIINDMVELIKQVASKTNILSINASIEASRSGEAGVRFSVVAGEIRELSKETIESAKMVEKAAKDIQSLLSSIIISSGSESDKVSSSGKIVKSIFDNLENITKKIKNNYVFTQKIDVSIKQQESGSIQAAETMRQMAQIAMQSAEMARQSQDAAKNIVNLSTELELMVATAQKESGI